MKNKPSLPAYLSVLVLLASISLTACGGGGGGGGNTPPTNANTDWDQLVWDQDDWS